MNTKYALLVVTGLMLAWAGAASADMAMSWAGERQGVAKAAVAGDAEPAEATDAEAAKEDAEEEASITREEYLATVAYVEGEAAVDELSRRLVEDMFGPSDDGVGSQYGDSTLPGNGNDGAHLDGVKMTRSGGVAPRTGSGGSFSASDNAENKGFEKKEYTVGSAWINLNGGEGFGAWTPKYSGSATLAVNTISEDGGFIMQAGENPGEIAMMRSLNTDVGLASGTFSVSMWGAGGGADERGDFAGFAVYGADNSELFRWGFHSEVEWSEEEGLIGKSSYYYSLNGGQDYVWVDAPKVDDYPLPEVEVAYSLTWAQLGGTMQFKLSATEYWPNGPVAEKFTDYEVNVATPEYVWAIAAVVTEGGLGAQDGEGSLMTFDNLSVTNGVERAVPEPGTLSLLAAGLAALWLRKANRKK